jgi:acyl-CoA synthetase (AMP-forming)/AMP-acid ligase II
MPLRLIEKLREHAGHRPGAIAVRAAGNPQIEPVTWSALAREVEGVAACLVQHLPAGAVVLLCLPNRPDNVAAFLGVLAAGGTLLPIPVDSAPPEVASIALRTSAAGAIVSPETASLLSNLFSHSVELSELGIGTKLFVAPRWDVAAVNAGPALLLQSSGTTGQPKIVRREGPSLDAVSANMVEACGFTSDDHVLAAVPLSHSYGLEHGILAPIWAGSCVHVADGFDLPVVLSELREAGITLLPGVPFMFEMLCRAEGNGFPNLRRAYSAGGPLPRQTYDAFKRRCGHPVGQLYGATEIGSVTFSDPDSPGFDPASVGKPMRNVSIRILDLNLPHALMRIGEEGQVAIAAPSMLSGYADAEPAPLADGHFLTGDIGKLNEHGALTITGRLKLLIDVGGRKVNPAEVEAVLLQHPDVGLCAVVPMRVSPTVSRVKAVVTPARADIEISVQDLRQFARERLSAYKVPRTIEVRSSLPTSPVGKVLRHLVEAP